MSASGETLASSQLILSLTVLFALLIIALTVVMATALKKIQTGHSTSLRLLFEQTQFLKLTTVLIVIIAATYLSVANKLSEGIVAILSGVAGYVLGGLRDRQDTGERTPSAQS